MRILVLEDDRALAREFGEALERAGHMVELAHTNTEAFGLLGLGVFEILICDLLIGGETSIPVLDYANVAQPDAEIIMVTASGLFPSGELHYSHAGVSYRAQKPIRIEELLLIVEHFGRTRPGPAAAPGECVSA